MCAITWVMAEVSGPAECVIRVKSMQYEKSKKNQ